MADQRSNDTAERERAAWMAAAQAGDGRAYARLLQACVPLAQAAARRQGVPPDRVDDVVQDVLLTVHRVRQTYDPTRPFDAWLRAIAQRRAIDLLRRSSRQGAREVHAPFAYDAHPDPAEAAPDSMERSDRSRALSAAIAELPPGQRQAVEQMGLRERSLAEVAADTGRTTGALKVNLHRALRALRTRIDDPGRK